MSKTLPQKSLNQFIKETGHILDEHLNCMGQIVSALYFGSETYAPYNNKLLEKFIETCSPDFPVSTLDIERLEDLHNMLSQKTTQIPKGPDSKLDENTFHELFLLSNEVIFRLRRLETDLVREGSGIDPLTELRSQVVLIDDLERELSACERRNEYLGIALGRIDQFEIFKKNLYQEERNTLLRDIAHVLKHSMRLYDDAYRYLDAFFVICFKHTDRIGSVSAVERFVRNIKTLRVELPEDNILFSLEEPISLSYSVAKLESGADIQELLANLKQDLESYPNDRELILEYNDISRIEQFVRQKPE